MEQIKTPLYLSHLCDWFLVMSAQSSYRGHDSPGTKMDDRFREKSERWMHFVFEGGRGVWGVLVCDHKVSKTDQRLISFLFLWLAPCVFTWTFIPIHVTLLRTPGGFIHFSSLTSQNSVFRPTSKTHLLKFVRISLRLHDYCWVSIFHLLSHWQVGVHQSVGKKGLFFNKRVKVDPWIY